MMALTFANGAAVFLLELKRNEDLEKELISHAGWKGRLRLRRRQRLKEQQPRLPAVRLSSSSGCTGSIKAVAKKERSSGNWKQTTSASIVNSPCSNREVLFACCPASILRCYVEKSTCIAQCNGSSSQSSFNQGFIPDTFAEQIDTKNLDEFPTSSAATQMQTSAPGFFRRKFRRNRFLWWLKFRSNFNTAFQRFFKSEIRRRAFVTITLLIASRIGYFIPLPGFDRRALPSDYLGFVSGRIEDLGDLGSEMKLSIFQLGISPYLLASMGMQLACHVIPSLVTLRTKGFDGHAKIKKYTFQLTLLFAILESLAISFYSLPYAVCAAERTFRHLIVTTSLLTFGAMTLHWISKQITTEGFGEGSSLIICLSILTGYANSLQQIARSITYDVGGCSALFLLFMSTFIITLWAVVVNEGRRKIKMQYFDLELMQNSGRLNGLPEVEPYIPFNINPTGMQPILTTSYLMAFPSVVASITGAQFWVRLKDMLNPASSAAVGAKPWLYHSLNMIFVFIFNVLDIGDTPKELSNYMMKIGTRIPNVKPGRQTIEYLGKVQASTRFWGGILLGMLATVSALVEHTLRAINQDISIGFTSMLIIVGSVAELRRSFKAYNVMPSLNKILKGYGV